MARTFVIGDIHGALKALEQLLATLQLQRDDRLIFLGDYVDGWSQSAQLIEYLMKLSKKYDCIFIRGNHDAWCASWLAGNTADEKWLIHGGQATVNSYKGFTKAKKALQLNFIEGMLNYFTDGDRLFVHAGFTSMHGAEREPYETNYSWDRTLWELAMALDKTITRDSIFYPKRLLRYEEIFIGHTPTTNYGITTPMQAGNVWNIDTGAAFYGRLSAMDITTKQFYQSDEVYRLYPDEMGRNK